jgi:hypothetical protein
MSPEQPVRFAGSALDGYRHVCAFFHTQDEEYRILLPFIKEGIDRKRQRKYRVDKSWPILTMGLWRRLLSTEFPERTLTAFPQCGSN